MWMFKDILFHKNKVKKKRQRERVNLPVIFHLRYLNVRGQVTMRKINLFICVGHSSCIIELPPVIKRAHDNRSNNLYDKNVTDYTGGYWKVHNITVMPLTSISVEETEARSSMMPFICWPSALTLGGAASVCSGTGCTGCSAPGRDVMNDI